MTTRRKYRDYWTEAKQVVPGPDGEPVVKQTVCCCKVAAGTRRECADASGNKTPCRCDCHSRLIHQPWRAKIITLLDDAREVAVSEQEFDLACILRDIKLSVKNYRCLTMKDYLESMSDQPRRRK